MLSGVHAVKHAVRFGARLDRVVSADPAAAQRLLAAVAPDVTLDVEQVPVEEVVRLAGGPVELLGLARRPESVPAGDGPAILLDNPRHLGNLGACVIPCDFQDCPDPEMVCYDNGDSGHICLFEFG